MNETELLDVFIQEGTAWVRQLRNDHRPRGRPLSTDEWTALAAYFSPHILEKTRLDFVPRIENPPFYQQLSFTPLDFTQWGLTVHDTVLIVESHTSNLSLLFHELVHVVQYDILGIDECIKQYVTGWAMNGKMYEQIPAEQEALAMQAQFEGGSTPFQVVAIVGARLKGSIT